MAAMRASSDSSHDPCFWTLEADNTIGDRRKGRKRSLSKGNLIASINYRKTIMSIRNFMALDKSPFNLSFRHSWSHSLLQIPFGSDIRHVLPSAMLLLRVETIYKSGLFPSRKLRATLLFDAKD